MADLSTLPAAPEPPAGHPNGARTSSSPARTVRSPRRLPGGRAVVGGFLVAASAVGTFAAWTAASSPPSTAYVVVTADVGGGQRIGAGQVALVAMELPEEQRPHAFAELADLDGAVALAPMAAGQLVQTSDVARPAGAPERAQISLSLDPGSALGGDPALLGEGEQVAVISTLTQGGRPETATVSSDAVVVKVIDGRERVGGGSGLTVVLAVRPGDLEPVAGAAAAGTVALARTTGVAAGTGSP
ncbi:MAG TPA: SAF domain-containing protein [Acidimicrobiales bacterium]|nr:SAF domain-containing protein [Acidimicrobiales bacterium]